MKAAAVTRIEFTPCTGFGTTGRSASIYDADGNYLGTGYGSVDEEAVAEALMNMGLTYGQAYDEVASVLKQAKQVRN